MFDVLALLSTNLVFDLAARDDLDDEEDDLGEEVDLVFFLFCFFGILGRSVGGGASFNI